MSSVIQNLLDNVIGDGARSSKFDCFINFNTPVIFEKQDDILAMVKTSQFPGKTHEVIDFKFKGRTIPIKGQTKYDNTWTCTFYMTQDHALKRAFEDWIESIDQVHNIKNVSDKVAYAQGYNNSQGYVTQMSIKQLDFLGTQVTAEYNLYGVFPKSVQAVDVDYSSVGTITEFTVEFAYVYFDTETDKTNSGTYVDELRNKALKQVRRTAQILKDRTTNIVKSGVGRELSMIKPKVTEFLDNLF